MRHKSAPRRHRNPGTGFRSVRTRGARRARPSGIRMSKRAKISTVRRKVGHKPIATRTTIRPKLKTPFKIQTEISHGDIVVSVRDLKIDTPMVINGTENGAMYIAPKPGPNEDRCVSGNKAQYMCANIRMVVHNRRNVPVTMRFTLIQVMDQKEYVTGAQNSFFTNQMCSNYWFNQNKDLPCTPPLGWANITGYLQRQYVHNKEAWKVLRQEIVDLGRNDGTGPINPIKHVHMFCRMGHTLDKDLTCTFEEPVLATRVAVTRMATKMPVFLVWEVLPNPGDVFGANTTTASVMTEIKHTIRDNV